MKFMPHEYQKYAIEYIKTHPVTALFLDMGLGKTVTTLTAIRDLMYDSFEIKHVLVVAPLRVARDTWPGSMRTAALISIWSSWTSCRVSRTTSRNGSGP